MTQQQKREKAAELLGWKRMCNVWLHPCDRKTFDGAPPLDEDLNLMAGAENSMTDEQYADYSLKVCGSVNRRPLSATAAQRLDAWLEVMMEGKP